MNLNGLILPEEAAVMLVHLNDDVIPIIVVDGFYEGR